MEEKAEAAAKGKPSLSQVYDDKADEEDAQEVRN